ncbi:HAD family hydrolase [Thermophilibacter immobilis]|uniref:HAD family phosphatase n=1 Tax=Thermophilibacter immobilis TaxID=2779519 RepID=A0A7S7RU34_9ACTN|nr:HAD family phosphatase [Thermophilibacter immobilis]QOY60017.1 HAD family phosphatase [Thermophilibacter immobilis]
MDRPTGVECALFDFDGTLADTEAYNMRILASICRKFGVEPTISELGSIASSSGEETVPALFAGHGREVSAEEFFSDWSDNKDVYYELPLKIAPGVEGLLGRIRTRGVRTCVVSTTEADRLEAALGRTGMRGYFDDVVGWEATERHKPDPDPYLEGLRRMGADAFRSVVFEDSPAGVRAGKAAGAYVFGCHCLSTKFDVSAADEVIDTFEGLEL